MQKDHTAGLGVTPLELCLDFVNTEGTERNSPPDRLESLDVFLEWAVDRGVVEARQAAAVRRATGGPQKIEGFLTAGRTLREALYRIFSALAAGAEPAASDLTVLDRQLAGALPRLELTRDAGAFGWAFSEAPARAEELLWPIALSAADLLRSERLARVKECAGDTCSWMFIDTSRNRSRRWCDMSDCGNRAKARRFYHRHLERSG